MSRREERMGRILIKGKGAKMAWGQRSQVRLEVVVAITNEALVMVEVAVMEEVARCPCQKMRSI